MDDHGSNDAEVRCRALIAEIQRIYELGHPAFSVEFTDKADPYLDELAKLVSADLSARDVVLDFLWSCEDVDLAWKLRHGFLVDRDDTVGTKGIWDQEYSVAAAACSVPAKPAVYWVQDRRHFPKKERRKVTEPWTAFQNWMGLAPQDFRGSGP